MGRRAELKLPGRLVRIPKWPTVPFNTIASAAVFHSGDQRSNQEFLRRRIQAG